MRPGLGASLFAALILVAACTTPARDRAAPVDTRRGPAAAENAGGEATASAADDDDDEPHPSGAPPEYAPDAKGNIASARVPAATLTPPILFELLAADVSMQRGQPGTAFTSYYSLARQVRDPRLARRATEIALRSRAFPEAVNASKLWSELDPESVSARRAYEMVLLANGDLKDAEPQMAAQLKRARAENKVDETYDQWRRTLPRIEKKKEAWPMIQRLSAEDLDRVSARTTRAAVAESAGELNAAADEAQAASKLAPRDARLAIVAARMRGAVKGEQDRAIEQLEDTTKRFPKEALTWLSLGQTYLAAGNAKDARRTLEEGIALHPTHPQMMFTLAQAQYQAKDLAASDATLQRYIDLPGTTQREPSAAWIFRSQIAEDQKDLPRAIAHLAQVNDGPLFLNALARRAVLTARNGDVDGALALAAPSRARNTEERSMLLSTQAQILHKAGRSKEAFELLSQNLSKDPKNPDLLYEHAMAAERIDRIDVMEQSLRKLIAAKPDHAHAYNALGYTLADRNQRLPEAKQLIEKALNLQPDDAQIMDSLGWVLFRMGDHDGALRELRKAYKLRPEVDIAAHLGEVLWAKGDRQEARRVWTEAWAREPNNETLRQTLKRFQVTP